MSNNVLDTLKGNLIVSCQALEHEPLYNPDFSLMPYMAKAALQAGAKGIRANSARGFSKRSSDWSCKKRL